MQKNLESVPQASRLEQAFVRFLESARLPQWLALLAVLLSASCLGLGFYLDDHVGRYLYSNLEGADRLFRLWVGGYGLANGEPSDAHWQIEQGWAPWWIYDHLLIKLFRPFGAATHWLDMHAWPHSAFLMHLHSLLWLALLVLAVTHMYRATLGTLIGGLAALLFAFDHTHGFVVGYICNRHALVTALLCVLCLERHVTARARGAWGVQLVAYVLYALALASGESALSILCYLVAYALCVEHDAWLARGVRVLPYLLLTMLWRALYNRAGFGAYGSGLYIDPGRDPLAYLLALCERGPVLLLGQFLAPPAELYSVVPTAWARGILVLAVVFSIALALALVPLLLRSRTARFWALGALGSLVPAASTYPHDRQLLFTSFGAMALLAELWQLHGITLRGQTLKRGLRFSRELCGLVFVAHVIVSPIALPLTTCTIALTTPLSHAPESITDDIADHDAVFVNAPDYFAVKLVQLERRIDQRPLPRRWRALAFGPEHITATRVDERTLELEFREGILSTPFMELYRDRRFSMAPGDRVDLAGLSIQVLAVTADGRAQRVRFGFDMPLESPRFRFYQWVHGRFERFVPPMPGSRQELLPARLDFGLE